jgi:hypothetical protein
MPSNPAAPVAFANMIAGHPKGWAGGQLGKRGGNIVNVTIGLFKTPFFERIPPNPLKIALSLRR